MRRCIDIRYIFHGFTQVRVLQYKKALQLNVKHVDTFYCSCLYVSYTHNSIRFQVTIVGTLTIGIVAVTKYGVSIQQYSFLYFRTIPPFHGPLYFDFYIILFILNADNVKSCTYKSYLRMTLFDELKELQEFLKFTDMVKKQWFLARSQQFNTAPHWHHEIGILFGNTENHIVEFKLRS